MYTNTYKEILYKNIFTYRIQLKFSNIKNYDKIILYKIDSMQSNFYIFCSSKGHDDFNFIS